MNDKKQISIINPVMPCGECYDLKGDFYFTCHDCLKNISGSCSFLNNLSYENKQKLEKEIGKL